MTTTSLPVYRVAVLDDDCDLATAVAAVLSKNSLHARAFNTAESLLEACDGERFDAFVLDWLLADRTTFELIRTLRTTHRSARAPIFLLSGSLTIGEAPSDPALAQAITSYHLHCRVKPYSALRLAKDVLAVVSPDA
jgi:DNA-binding NtrC family response regulator